MNFFRYAWRIVLFHGCIIFGWQRQRIFMKKFCLIVEVKTTEIRTLSVISTSCSLASCFSSLCMSFCSLIHLCLAGKESRNTFIDKKKKNSLRLSVFTNSSAAKKNTFSPFHERGNILIMQSFHFFNFMRNLFCTFWLLRILLLAYFGFIFKTVPTSFSPSIRLIFFGQRLSLLGLAYKSFPHLNDLIIC